MPGRQDGGARGSAGPHASTEDFNQANTVSQVPPWTCHSLCRGIYKQNRTFHALAELRAFPNVHITS